MKSVDLIKFPPSTIREALKSIITKDMNKGIMPGQVALRVNSIYVYSWRMQACFQIMRDEVERLNYDDNRYDKLREIVLEDFYDVGLHGACYVWLCLSGAPRLEDFDIPEIMWTKINIPDTIRYGLVLEHYSIIMRMAQYMARLTVEEEHALLDARDIKHIEEIALVNTVDTCLKNNMGFTREEIEKKVANITMI